MRVLLSSNPYRDRGLRVALEARRILNNAGMRDTFSRSIDKVWDEKVDVMLGNHPFHNDTYEKHERVLRGEKVLSEDLALNDAVISKGSMARVAEMEVRADGVLVTNLMGDGVIVSTPTGSTAYSMSAGGPIVEPTSRDIIVTPVCAHQLSTRSMVLAPERLVTVQLPRGSRKHLYLAVDGGKALRITGTERVEISCARQSTRLIRLTERNFYQIIYQKLGGYEL